MHLDEFAPAIPKAVGGGLAALGGSAGSSVHHHREGSFQIAREEIDRRLGRVCQAQAAKWLRGRLPKASTEYLVQALKSEWRDAGRSC